MDNSNFYTLKGYDRQNSSKISVTMEDYLEMIYRCAREDNFVRVNRLASMLNVTPPSSSKMAAKLKEQDLIDFEPYGIIRLTAKGAELGAYLLRRHEILNRFFCIINRTDGELALVEKIEHFIDRRTIENIEKRLLKDPDFKL